MKIVTWFSTNAPTAAAWSARLLLSGGFLPVVFLAATEDAATQKASAFWALETARKGGPAIEKRLGRLVGEEIVNAATPVSDVDADHAVSSDPLGELLG